MKLGVQLGRALGALNGLIGDRLSEAHSPLALRMALIDDDHHRPPGPLAVDGGRVLVFVHGLMDTDVTWFFSDGGYGVWLERDLRLHPLYLRYNSGRAIADNGFELARLLERALGHDEIREIGFVAHSMGGLVVRSACHHGAEAKHAWLGKVRRAVYLGTPHQGAPLERAGRVVTHLFGWLGDPVSKRIAQLGDLRSAGIKDLGDADLRHADRERRAPTYRLRDAQHPVPLLSSIDHYLIASTLYEEPWLIELFGDAIVPLASATANELSAPTLPPSHITILRGLAHPDLSHDRRVYAQLAAIFAR